MTDISPTAPDLRREWAVVGLLLVIMIVKGILWSLALPLWQGPDEDDHYAVIQFIAETGRLPDEGDTLLVDEVALSREMADVGRLPYAPEQRQGFSDTAVGPNEPVFAQLPLSTRSSVDKGMVGKLMHATPLYYIIGAGVYRLFDGGDLLARAQIQRLLAVLVSAPLVVMAYLTTRLLFPTNSAMRLTIPILVAFQPMITEISAVVSVDGLYFLCYSLLIYLSIRVFRDGFYWGYGLAIGAVFVVGSLTKPTLNGYAPLITLLVAYDWWRGKGRRKQIVLGTVAMGMVILPPTIWWMERSWRLNNDLFYFNPVVEGHRILQNPFYDYGIWAHMIDYYQSVWGGIFVTWWAHFGWLDTALPPWVYYLLRWLTFAAIAGLVFRLAQLKRRPLSPQRWAQGGGTAPLGVWLFLALTLLLPIWLIQFYDLTFWWEYGNGRGLQGRYWLGTVIPMLTFFAAGLLVWLPSRWRPALHTALRIGMVALNFISLLGYVMPRYYL
jgi:hypothetical protein